MSDNGRTSKTAHVMNLLNKGRVSESPPHTPAQTSSDPLPLSSIGVSTENDHAVSEAVKQALEDELRKEEPEARPRTPPEESELAAKEPESAAEEPEPAAEEPEPAAKEPEPAAKEPEPAAKPRPGTAAESQAVPGPPPESPAAPPCREVRDSISYFNVMELLVEEKAEKYIKMFGLCPCQRCAVDVKALALCSLPPKYVVMQPHERIPRISLYESRYCTAVTAQVMRACKTVMDNPRHDL